MIRNHLARRSLVLAIVMGALATTPAIAAVQELTLSLTAAGPGASISLRVEMSARDGTYSGSLYLVPQAAFDVGPFDRICEQVPGTIALGDLAFHRETVEISAWTGEGYVAQTTFTVPTAAAGHYYLSETIAARGTGCHVFGAFTVTERSLPDTALPSATSLTAPGPAPLKR